MLLKRSLLTMAFQATQLAALFVIAVVVTRATGPHGQGVFTLVVVIAFLAPLVTGLGLTVAAVYHLGRGIYPAVAIFSTTLTFAIASAALSMLAVTIGYLLLRHTYFRDVSDAGFGFLLAMILASHLLSSCAALVLGTGRPIHYAALNAIPAIVAIVVMAVLWGATLLTVDRALMSWAIGNWIAAAAAVGLASRVGRIRLGIHRPALNALLGFGLQSYLANVASFLNYRLDSLIINALLNVVNLGYYSIAVAMSEAIWYLANAVSTVMFPHVSSMDRKQADRLIASVCRNTLLATFIGCVAMLLLGRWLVILIFTDRMLPAVQALWLLLPGTLMLGLGKVASSYFIGIGKPIYGAYVAPMNLVLTVGLDLLLIPRYGINGAAVASSIVYTLGSVIALALLRKESKQGIWEILVVQPSDFRRYAEAIAGAYGRLAAYRSL